MSLQKEIAVTCNILLWKEKKNQSLKSVMFYYKLHEILQI